MHTAGQNPLLAGHDVVLLVELLRHAVAVEVVGMDGEVRLTVDLESLWRRERGKGDTRSGILWRLALVRGPSDSCTAHNLQKPNLRLSETLSFKLMVEQESGKIQHGAATQHWREQQTRLHPLYALTSLSLVAACSTKMELTCSRRNGASNSFQVVGP
jgi:hypothetical protein